MCKCEWEDVVFMCTQTAVDVLPEEMVGAELSSPLAPGRLGAGRKKAPLLIR